MALSTYHPAGLVKRQNRETELLDKLYDILPPVGIEKQATGAEEIGKELGLTISQMSRFAINLEQAGILNRRLEYNWTNPKGEKLQGRSWHWTLTVEKEEAYKKLVEFHKQELSQHSKLNQLPTKKEEPSLPPTSVKGRILEALANGNRFDTVGAVLLAIRKPNENLDLHSLTHQIYDLKRIGLVDFKEDKSGKRHYKPGSARQGHPYDIRLMKRWNGSTTAPKVAEEEPKNQPETIDEYIKKVEPIPVNVVEDKFPLIEALVGRRTKLETAAKFADEAGAVEEAVALLEKSKQAYSPFEGEAVKLYEAYQECKNK